MSTTTTMLKGTPALRTTIYYLAPGLTEPPFHIIAPRPGEKATNIVTAPYDVSVSDVRGREADFMLDSSAFQYVNHTLATETVEALRGQRTDEIRQKYYPEVEALLGQVTGAARVVAFDHNVRNRGTEERLQSPSNMPAKQAHVDQTPYAAEQRVRQELPTEAEELLKRRFQIINVWRPLIPSLEDWPLAVADYRSLDYEEDLAAVDLRFPNRRGETFIVRHSPEQRWYFLSKQQIDEVLLIKCFDSLPDVARLCPHVAFDNPTAPKEAPFRESCEVRCFVFY